MFSTRVARLIAGKVGYTVSCFLAGFFTLARDFGGIEACVAPTKVNATADANLPDTDLSRTHRQQAVIDYVIWEPKNENAFSDIGQLTALLGDAKQWLITNAGFNLFDFATSMSALTGKNLTFYTLPIAGFADVDLNGSMQDVNNIDVGCTKPVVPASLTPSSTSTPSPAASSSAAAADNGAAGGVVTVAPNAKYGIPCVY